MTLNKARCESTMTGSISSAVLFMSPKLAVLFRLRGCTLV
ncbi:Uncharacterised protein [Serratia fonticola]|uniref:Uncharacterized protein n=1 Tax=Serratia fonticola TaxID=47917 RepID=A0A4U9VWX2_SERFO|nr:Uncharacterised protein [Serratia fonticola]